METIKISGYIVVSDKADEYVIDKLNADIRNLIGNSNISGIKIYAVNVKVE